MARSDYASILNRHAGSGETLAGGVIVPTLDTSDTTEARGRAHIDAAMMYGNRWPALYGGYLFDMADRVGRAATGVLPRSLEMHFLRAIRRRDVCEHDGLEIAWRARVDRDEAHPVAAQVSIGAEDAPYAHALVVCGKAEADGADCVPARIVLPAHDVDWKPGVIRGRCLESPGSFAAIADTLVAKAMATVRGDGCDDDIEEHFLVRTLSYTWLAPLNDGPATFEACVVQRGRRMALAVGELQLEGRIVGRAAGTVVIERRPQGDSPRIVA